MVAVAVALAALAALGLGYRFYSRYLARAVFHLRDDEPLPAIEREDGLDFVPTRREVLWGHHFASIAGAAPILGPAMAIVWGWVPALCWIVIGVIFMGAAHDFGALVLSMRHDGESVGTLTKRFIGPRSRVLFLLIIFFLIWLVGAVFAFAIAGLFVAFPASILPVNLEIVVAVAIGWWGYRRKRSLLLPSIAALALLYLAIFGSASGALWSPAEGSLLLDKRFWLVALLAYAFVASSLPVWLLLQPRDLINSHQLIVGLGALYVGFFLARPEFAAPAVGELSALPAVFPLLFVTIACGAISGFHGLVGSGTTSKQICRATDARPIGYGAMLCEAALAVLATLAVATGLWSGPEHVHAWEFLSAATAPTEAGGALHLPQVPQALAAFVNGAGGFLSALGLPVTIAQTVVAVLVISFAATSLDTALRIQRLILAELGVTYRIAPLTHRWIGGALACGSVGLLIWADYDQGAKSLWPVFGATNQVLAAFTLLLCALYLRTLGRRATAYSAPAVLVMAITISAMGVQVWRDFVGRNWGVAAVGAMIGLLTVWVALEGALAWRRGPKRGAGADASASASAD
ncbi:MAG: carbon starvation protein A [Planctomycetes bacterium]|jgi:carbon starvation protein|nr:carbon starvation protein A [Planctomycetota bacterium]MDP6407993.1 carbon starvation protein A [Planctomycetota bacterium]